MTGTLDGRPEGFEWIERPGTEVALQFDLVDDQTGHTFELRLSGQSPVLCDVAGTTATATVTIPPAGTYSGGLWETTGDDEIVTPVVLKSSYGLRRPSRAAETPFSVAVLTSGDRMVTVTRGSQGPAGPPGPAGSGTPAGGTTGQALLKASNTDGDTVWTTLTKSLVGLANVDNTSDANKPVSTLQAAADSAARAAAEATAASALAAHVVASDPHGDRAYAQSLFASNDALLYKGAVNCSTNPNYPAADAGHFYKVSVAGKIGGASGPNVEAGDTLICLVDGTSAGTDASVGANWDIIQVNIDGAVIGPASAVSGQLAAFSGTSGKLVADSGMAIDLDATLAANSDTRIASQKAVKGYVDTASGLLVPKSLVDAKGDLLVGTADNTVARLAVGTDGQVLTADSASAGGVKWAAASAASISDTAYGGSWDGVTTIAPSKNAVYDQMELRALKSVFAYKSGDTTRTNTTTETADPDLVLALAANKTYQISGFLIVSAASTTPDFKWGLFNAGGGTWTGKHGHVGMDLGATSGLAQGRHSVNALGSTISAGAVTSEAALPIWGLVVTDGTAANLEVRWAQSTLDASNGVTLQDASHIRAIPVA